MDSIYEATAEIFMRILGVDGTLTPEMIITKLPKLLEQIETLNAKRRVLTGPEKKKIVIETLRKVILKVQMDDEEREQMLDFVEDALPMIIDVVVYAYNSKFFIKLRNSIGRRLKSCFKCSGQIE